MTNELDIATSNLRGACVTVDKQFHMLFRVTSKRPRNAATPAAADGENGIARGLADAELWHRILSAGAAKATKGEDEGSSD